MTNIKPKEYIWIAKDIITKDFVFIHYGMKYDQARYTLLYTISAYEVNQLVTNQTDS